MNNPDVIIIGAGIIGCAAAFELSKKGYKTLNIEKLGQVGAGSTVNSCGIVRFSYSTYDGVALAYEGVRYWENWADYLEVEDKSGLAQFNQCGTLILKSPTHKIDKMKWHYSKLQIPYEEWGAEKVLERLPVLSSGSYYPPSHPDEDEDFWDEPSKELEGALYTPDSGYVNDPQLATHNLAVAARAKGATFMFGNVVKAIRRTDDKILGVTIESGQQIDAPIVINVAGPHSYIINQMAGVADEMRIKTKALRHEVHHVPAPAGFRFDRKGMHVSDGDTGVYFRPETGNHILVGSGDPDCDKHQWVSDPDDFNRGLTQHQWNAQVYRLAQRIPDLPLPNEKQGVVDLYDVSDDWLPIYDKSSLGGYYMAVGTSGNQFKNAAPVGYMLTQLIDAVENGHDHDNDPVKYRTVYEDLELNIGFYSRLREINEESSFTVSG
ncbi:MAG: FAD-dependent oxidoreductase [Chloroflexota bacterium]